MDDKIMKQLKESWSRMESIGDDIYDADVVSDSILGSALEWLGKKIDIIFGAHIRQKGSPNKNAMVIKKYLSKKYEPEVIEKIEQIYRDSVLSIMADKGLGKYVNHRPGIGNFGEIIFNDEVFTMHWEEMEQVENEVKQILDNSI